MFSVTRDTQVMKSTNCYKICPLVRIGPYFEISEYVYLVLNQQVGQKNRKFEILVHLTFKLKLVMKPTLRASDSIYRESRDRTENSNFILFRPKDPFGELFSKILFKSSSEFNFLRNLRKLEIPPDRARIPNNGTWNFCKIEQFQHASTESRKVP